MKYDWNSNKYTTISELQEKVSNELIEQLSFNENDHVLDAGCGIGNITFKVAKTVKSGHILGIDSSLSMIKRCNENLNATNTSNVNPHCVTFSENQIKSVDNLIFY